MCKLNAQHSEFPYSCFRCVVCLHKLDTTYKDNKNENKKSKPKQNELLSTLKFIRVFQ